MQAQMKIKQKQLFKLVDLLEKANGSIPGFERAAADAVNTIHLLTSCQEKAISVGDGLESYGDAAGQLISLLEEYCECVYQISQSFDNENTYNRLLSQCANIIGRVNGGIRDELPADKKEVLFLPYKASMWDSLESVWMRAKEDEECDAYVVPIPYFDKNPDGTIREWHYEGNEYPGYVPVTPWEEYDIAERRPDAVFIHNPYDGTNYVTSVHPAFYSSELKKYTDMLVYIPYFICLDDVEEHFCKAPAVFNADRVVVQPGKVRDTYIRVYMEQAGEKQREFKQKTGREDKGFWERMKKTAEEKFLALGSPKVDRVRNTKKEDVEIPREWEKLMRRADGTAKKVLLYNTTIEAFLNNRDAYLPKLQMVLQQLKQEKEITLLWRPHPLLQGTLDSMAPQLAGKYRRIVQEYRDGGWGIYDDTPDLNRAIAISDAYYGDMSSVVALYRETGKPIIYQKLNETNVFALEMGIVEKNFLLCPMVYLNAVAKIELLTGKMEILLLDEERIIFAYALYRMLKLQDDLVMLFPSHGNKFLVWSMGKGICNEIPLAYPVDINYVSAIRRDGEVYFIPYRNSAVAQYDLNIKSMKYKKLKTDCNNLFARSGVLVNDSLILVHYATEKSYEYNLNTGKMRELDKFGNCNSICSDGRICWLGRNDNVVLRWDTEINEIQELNLPDEYNSNLYPLWNCFCINKYVIFESFQANMVLRVNIETRDVTKLNLPIEELEIHVDKDDRCYCIAYDEEYAYFLSQRQSMIIKSNIVENVYEILNLSVCLDDIKQLEKVKVQFPFGEYEQYISGDFPTEDVYPIQYLIHHIPYIFDISKNYTNKTGERIFEFIKNQINLEQNENS